jgi:hypothetical protein
LEAAGGQLDDGTEVDRELHEFIAGFYDDPLGFVVACYPWPIHGEAGPDRWQAEVLREIGASVEARRFDGVTPVPAFRKAIASGHGIGKSVLFAWVVDWIMSTRPDCRGTVTAGTNEQLEKKTWAAVREWTARCLTAHWFAINSKIMYRIGHRPSWFCAPQSSAEENSEAFAGQHAKNSTSFYLFDEASAVPPKIHEVAEGGLTDGEPLWLMAGNPTRNEGKFYEATFGARKDRWHPMILDSRTCRFHNAALIAEWLDDYGEDSDFFRVRVRGVPPASSALQYIDHERIRAAQRRIVLPLEDDPLIVGVDVSGGGAAWTVAMFRRGADARSIPPIRISGHASRDRNLVIATLAEALSDGRPERRIEAMFIDAAFGSPMVERLRVLGYKQVHEINFGATAPDHHQSNQRAYQWAKMKEWLLTGAIPTQNVRLAHELGVPGFHLNRRDQLVLEAKESMLARGEASPDEADALSLTFAQPVNAAIRRGRVLWMPAATHWAS